MFTGLIEEIGKVEQLKKKRGGAILAIQAKRSSRGLKIDDSIAINGVCLTVIARRGSKFNVQAVEETLRKTNLGLLREGDPVNLERALLPNERLGGHFVLGHVDGVGTIEKVQARKSSWMFWIKVPKRFARYLIPVGSIAVNGVSLTVASLRGQTFGVSIIPHTMKMTTFKNLKVGDRVNIEFDMLGKYIERLLKARKR
ncbi:MAG: riboflavin synthase [Ignavibacteriales bacterium]|nr:riboflavin synthase [Ignavibacteriales bacterium]MBI3788186.1 riboflavin synthase [Ignavibacteriales bacterium]